MGYKITGVMLALILAVAIHVPSTQAQTSNIENLLAQLQTLMAQVEELRAQLAEVRGEVRDVIKDGLREGMTDDQIKEIQEILATDRSVYPEGIASGYFGPLTKRAIERFQNKFDLDVTGVIDDETKAALETLIRERRENGKVPDGLLHAPGIIKKFESRLRIHCDNSGSGNDLVCKRIKSKYHLDDDDNDDSDDDASDDDSNDSSDDSDSDDDSDDSDDDSEDDSDSDDDSDDDSEDDGDDE